MNKHNAKEDLACLFIPKIMLKDLLSYLKSTVKHNFCLVCEVLFTNIEKKKARLRFVWS